MGTGGLEPPTSRTSVERRYAMSPVLAVVLLLAFCTWRAAADGKVFIRLKSPDQHKLRAVCDELLLRVADHLSWEGPGAVVIKSPNEAICLFGHFYCLLQGLRWAEKIDVTPNETCEIFLDGEDGPKFLRRCKQNMCAQMCLMKYLTWQ